MIEQLNIDLGIGLYQPSPYRVFVVREPKIREIFAPSFRDRLVHHLIVDRLMPLVDPRLMDESYANRPWKGAHRAVKRLQHGMRRMPPTAHYMKCDIASYFTSIDRRILLDLIIWHLQRITALDPDECEYIIVIIKAILGQNPAHNPVYSGDRSLLRLVPPHKSLFHTPPHVGMPIGSLTSQFFSNIDLNELDRFVKHQLKAPHYARYVDDFVLLAESPDQLLLWRHKIEDFLRSRLALTLHPQKTLVQPIHRGCDFLGFVVRPHNLAMRPRTIKSFKRRLYLFNHLLDPRKFPRFNPPAESHWEDDVRDGFLRPPVRPTPGLMLSMKQVINSYLGMMAHGDTYTLRRTLYLRHFHRLQNYFLPADGFAKVIMRPLEILRREGIIDM